MPVSRRSFVAATAAIPLPSLAQTHKTQSWPLNTPRRTGIHDIAPAPDGGVWFTAQASGHLGWFDPRTGKTELVALGAGSSPHGVIQGPDKAAWITDSGQNAIVRVAWPSREVKVMPLPQGTPYANLNTCAFDGDGDLWYTGQGGYVGKVAVKTGAVSVKQAPRGRGPYGICGTPSGDVWWCSLAGSFIARIDRRTGDSHVVEPPTKNQGARRVWSDSQGRIWVSEWSAGQLSVHDPKANTWKQWKPPGADPKIYAVYVDERDIVWTTDFGGDCVWSFDPKAEKFERYAFGRPGINVRQVLGRPGEIWLPESGTEHISVIRTA
ncbi:Vgb family protein [Ramlibacter sp. PS4R-6]|uniref:Vgb family protein n=1 Tax=Ramlibacter sp. PS4R-6 TaxID=3133438 RepID=UPI00309C6EE8